MSSSVPSPGSKVSPRPCLSMSSLFCSRPLERHAGERRRPSSPVARRRRGRARGLARSTSTTQSARKRAAPRLASLFSKEMGRLAGLAWPRLPARGRRRRVRLVDGHPDDVLDGIRDCPCTSCYYGLLQGYSAAGPSPLQRDALLAPFCPSVPPSPAASRPPPLPLHKPLGEQRSS